jgi:redox-sensitive bicupin YhaK (pirin superfamily)
VIQVRRAQERGHAEHGWLDAQHTFSFADYLDPDFMGFSVLRVLNQDRIRPGRGFPRHGHRDMEIVTYVLEGALEHEDSMGNRSRILPGEVQLMSAGTGVLHSEFNASRDAPLHLLQMWVIPSRQGTAPRYEQKAFPVEERRGRLRLVVAPDGSAGALTIDQDARLFTGLLHGPERILHRLDAGRVAWLHVARGSVRLNGRALEPEDGAAIADEELLTLENGADAELVLWDLPAPT